MTRKPKFLLQDVEKETFKSHRVLPRGGQADSEQIKRSSVMGLSGAGEVAQWGKRFPPCTLEDLSVDPVHLHKCTQFQF